MIIKPTISEEYVEINERFRAHYAHFIDGESFTRPDNTWTYLTKRQFISPDSNPEIKIPYDAGVKFGCYEHASVCISGTCDYIAKKHQLIDGEEVVGDMIYEWSFGMNNVENGFGYLPEEEFKRIFKSNYATCCMIPTMETMGKQLDDVYNFEVLSLENSIILDKNIKFIHVAYGKVSVGEQEYVQKENIMEVGAGAEIIPEEKSIIILGYIKEN